MSDIKKEDKAMEHDSLDELIDYQRKNKVMPQLKRINMDDVLKRLVDEFGLYVFSESKEYKQQKDEK